MKAHLPLPTLALGALSTLLAATYAHTSPETYQPASLLGEENYTSLGLWLDYSPDTVEPVTPQTTPEDLAELTHILSEHHAAIELDLNNIPDALPALGLIDPTGAVASLKDYSLTPSATPQAILFEGSYCADRWTKNIRCPYLDEQTEILGTVPLENRDHLYEFLLIPAADALIPEGTYKISAPSTAEAEATAQDIATASQQWSFAPELDLQGTPMSAQAFAMDVPSIHLFWLALLATAIIGARTRRSGGLLALAIGALIGIALAWPTLTLSGLYFARAAALLVISAALIIGLSVAFPESVPRPPQLGAGSKKQGYRAWSVVGLSSLMLSLSLLLLSTVGPGQIITYLRTLNQPTAATPIKDAELTRMWLQYYGAPPEEDNEALDLALEALQSAMDSGVAYAEYRDPYSSVGAQPMDISYFPSLFGDSYATVDKRPLVLIGGEVIAELNSGQDFCEPLPCAAFGPKVNHAEDISPSLEAHRISDTSELAPGTTWLAAGNELVSLDDIPVLRQTPEFLTDLNPMLRETALQGAIFVDAPDEAIDEFITTSRNAGMNFLPLPADYSTEPDFVGEILPTNYLHSLVASIYTLLALGALVSAVRRVLKPRAVRDVGDLVKLLGVGALCILALVPAFLLAQSLVFFTPFLDALFMPFYTSGVTIAVALMAPLGVISLVWALRRR
ncbi:hypothetical protein [Corynebacterium spheniscorum]|uniref:Membrane transport protein MMPL domain-containing protein n=1 Tax=Corynebacterium spheniscorum TaxID=185761 RepID=A0A1I2TNX4_9CORY|nr:hypothetical protein [Corynebacterium spheniscorum]KAA8724311.1 hypothetical protein F4V56_00715 [Corynebacterium spheniscorum]SFG66622.1 hypothetical protein SAMN05660282_01566 [Corynebacterium spheniscorum]